MPSNPRFAMEDLKVGSKWRFSHTPEKSFTFTIKAVHGDVAAVTFDEPTAMYSSAWLLSDFNYPPFNFERIYTPAPVAPAQKILTLLNQEGHDGKTALEWLVFAPSRPDVFGWFSQYERAHAIAVQLVTDSPDLRVFICSQVALVAMAPTTPKKLV